MRRRGDRFALLWFPSHDRFPSWEMGPSSVYVQFECVCAESIASIQRARLKLLGIHDNY